MRTVTVVRVLVIVLSVAEGSGVSVLPGVMTRTVRTASAQARECVSDRLGGVRSLGGHSSILHAT